MRNSTRTNFVATKGRITGTLRYMRWDDMCHEEENRAVELDSASDIT